MTRIRILSQERASKMGYSTDKRRRRRQHRICARNLMNAGTLLNGKAPRTSIPSEVASWHLLQARFL